MTSTRRTTFALALLAMAALLPDPAAAQRQPQPRTVRVPPLYPGYRGGPVRADTGGDSTGLRFRLSPGAGARPYAAATAEGRRLTDDEARRLFERLPPLVDQASPADSFAFPAATFPAPRTGRTVLAAFPPRDSLAAGRPATTGTAALSVVRRAPEGEVETGAEVTVSFSQPMVPLASVGELAGREVPVRLAPQPPGRWRWIDVRTLKFEPAGRLPMATEFAVEVPAGTRSAAGRALAEPVRWTFATPAPIATGGFPYGGPAGLEPVLIVAFDQRVDPAAVLRTVRLCAAGAEVPVRLATQAEIDADAEAKARVAGLDPARWIAFRPARPLPPDAPVVVSIGPGTPSAEGARRTDAEQAFEFRTYGRLRVERSVCSWGGPCRPGMPWSIQFNNPLDEGAWRDEWVRVEPALPGLEIQVYGNNLMIRGRARPNTRYTVRLDPAVRDRFGQTLGAARTVSFDVGAPEAQLVGPDRLVVLDPLGSRSVSFLSHDFRRLRVRVHRVAPEDWPAFARLEGRREDGRPAALPGTSVVDRTITIDAGPAETRETFVDVSPALTGGLGHAVVAVEAVEGGTQQERRQASYVWVQSTRIGLSAYADPEELLGWATSLVDGAPLAGAALELAPYRLAGTADARGIATLALPRRGPQDPPAYLVARLGADAAILPEESQAGPARWARGTAQTQAVWYLFTDRNLYRPGERVRFKGWVRRLEGWTAAPGLPGDLGERVAYTVSDPRGNEIARGTARLTALGGFDAEFVVPEGSNLGQGIIRVTLETDREVPGREGGTSFLVQEFRRPEYTVTASADPGPYFVGTAAEVTARAAYFAGGPLPGAPVRWDVQAVPAGYTPPGWDRWRFGTEGRGPFFWEESGDRARSGTLTAETGATGESALRIDFDRAVPPRAFAVTANATVTDVNRQTWTAEERLLVHPAEVYVGVRTERTWLERTDPLELDLVVVDLDGKPVAGRPVEVRVRRTAWRRVAGSWRQEESEAGACSLVSQAQPVRCTIPPGGEGGTYRVTATTTDARGRPTLTRLSVWVRGSDPLIAARPGDEVAPGQVEVIPDREEYAPGDTARLLLRLPFHPTRGVMTVRRGEIVRVEEVPTDGPTASVRLPVGEEDVPNLSLFFEFVGAGDGRQDPARARGVDFAVGQADLAVSRRTRALTVAPVPADSVAEPDGPGEVTVEVKDAAGRPVAGAEVAVAVVDEAVLALTGYRLPDPLDVFYRPRPALTTETFLRRLVRVEAPDFEPAPGTLVGRVRDAREGRPLAGVAVRVEGTALAAVTDVHGRYRIENVPPGSYRVTFQRIGAEPAVRQVTVVRDAAPPRLDAVLAGGALALEGLVATGAGVDVQRRQAADQYAVAEMAAPTAPPPPPPMAARVRAGGEAAPQPIAIRTNFDPLAVFAPALTTGPDGRVRLPFKLPSNLTRYRVVAVAVEGGRRYGVGESSLTVRQPLMVRPSAPRFLNFGDRFELPVVVQNQTGEALEVDVAARAVGVALAEPGRRITVPAHDRVEVRLPGEAVRAGPARFQVAAASGGRADAAEVVLPVWTPATAEAFAAYGSLAGDSVETLPLDVPADAIPAFGGVEVTTSSTALQELTDALLYLVRYPYECTEQIASRVLAVASLRDVLAAFRAEEMPAPAELAAFVEADVRRLAALQNSDGGWGFWKQGEPSWPYVSIHTAHALTRAREKGWAVPDETWRRALGYLRGVPGNVPGWYPEDVKRALHAYAIYVRARMGERVDDDVRRYLAQPPLDRLPAGAREWRASLPLEVAGWLLSASAGKPGLAAERDSLLRYLSSRATETASTATFATRYSEGEYLLLHSERRTDGVVLEALVAADRDNPLVPKVVRGLLGHRKRGRWNDTQENAWVLLALDRYFRTYEAETPAFVARVWLGERYAGGHEFRGRSTDRSLVSVPMRVVQEGRPESLTVGKEGPGRLYYRAGLRYAPRDLDVAPLEAGFVVERTYEAVDDPADVQLGPDGRWRVRAGARVRVTVTMTAPSRRVHVALADPLPAGFEPVNPDLQGAQPGSETTQGVRRGRAPEVRWWRPGWFEHQNLRDNRAEAFTSLLPAGVYTYSYVARATTPGLFIVPPPHAEEMYSPETFGRGKTERVIVETRPAPGR